MVSRFIDALEFRKPDRIPVFYHPSLAGLHVHGQKLLDLFNYYPPDNPTAFDTLPLPSSFDSEGSYHELKTDEWGVRWEHRIFGIQGHAVAFPFECWEASENYNFPEFVTIAKIADEMKDKYRIDGWLSLFMLMYALRPMEETLIEMALENQSLFRFLDKLTKYRLNEVDHLVSSGIGMLTIGDDLCTQSGPFVSPDFLRKHFFPRYKLIADKIKSKRRKTLFHCCGNLNEILDDLVLLGIDAVWAQLSIHGDDEVFFDKCRKNRISVLIHPDRQRLIPQGTPKQIEDQIKLYAERFRDGGGFFYVEIENDAPWSNVKALVESIDKYRG